MNYCKNRDCKNRNWTAVAFEGFYHCYKDSIHIDEKGNCLDFKN